MSTEDGERSVDLAALSSDWYWEQDAELRLARVSQLREKAGIDARSLLELSPGDWQRHREQVERREPFRDLEIRRLADDGRAVWLSLSGAPRFDPAGRFIGYHGLGREITAQKRAEELLALEHAVVRCLSHAETVGEGLRAALRAMCEMQGWDYGRYFSIGAASGALRLDEAWFARQPALEQLLERSRIAWQEGKAVWSIDAAGQDTGDRAAAAAATFAFPAMSAGKAVGIVAFSARAGTPPDPSLLDSARALGSLFGEFVQRKRAEESWRESEARFRSLTQLSSDFFWESDAEQRLSALVHGPGYGPARAGLGMLGRPLWDFASSSPDEEGWAAHKAVLASRLPFRDFEFARLAGDGTTRHYALSGEPRFAADGTFLGYRGVGRDVTEIALSRERIASLAYTDPLTGLANRTSLGPALEQAIERARRNRERLWGLFLDLDGFKAINDRHGHAAGDALLQEVARRIRRSLRASDVVARLGGDEFFIVLEQVHDVPAVERVVSKLVAELLRLYDVRGTKARLSASIGVSIFPDDAADAATLIEHADSAMYSAKQAGKNAYCLYAAPVPLRAAAAG